MEGMSEEELREAAGRLKEFHDRFRGCFYDKRQARESQYMMHGLLLEGYRKNAANIGRRVPEATVDGMQHFVGRSNWQVGPLRGEYQQLVAERIGSRGGVLVIDGSAVSKKGHYSAGVARQWNGRKGKIDNCQVGVYAAYVTETSKALVDARLFLPEEWIEDRERRRKAKVPADLTFQTKPEISLEVVSEAHNGPLPFQWTTADELYGRSSEWRAAVAGMGLWYVAEVPTNTKVRPVSEGAQLPEGPCQAQDVAEQIDHYRRMTVRRGSKGDITSRWARLRVKAGKSGQHGESHPEAQWMLIERKPSETKYYLSNAPEDVSLQRLAEVAKMRWFVEKGFRDAKQQAGLGDYETRTYPGWHHHTLMSMMAHFFLQTVQKACKKGD